MFLPVSESNNGEMPGCVEFDTRMLCHSWFLLTTSESCYLFQKQIMWTHQGLLRLMRVSSKACSGTRRGANTLVPPSCSSSTSWLVLGPWMETISSPTPPVAPSSSRARQGCCGSFFLLPGAHQVELTHIRCNTHIPHLLFKSLTTETSHF